MSNPIAHQRYNGTVVFVAVHMIKELDQAIAYRCLVEANKIAGESDLVTETGPAWVNPTISGLFFLVPDEKRLVVHKFVKQLTTLFAARGIAVRIGIAHGPFICVEDADKNLNFAGRAINTAARLTYAKENVGCLIDKNYQEHVAGFVLGPEESLARFEERFVPGKSHDAGFACRSLSKTDWPFLDAVDSKKVPNHEPSRHTSGLILAYDLPQFSAGDDSQIDKRVRSLVDAFRGFKQNRLPSEANMFFSPGGDGGVVVLENVREDAYGIALGLARAFLVESEYKEGVISVEARIGINYGVVPLYHDLRDVVRPTGLECFIADELTSDEQGKKAGLVFSEPLKNVISEGSQRTLENDFHELPLLKTGPAANTRRFAHKISDKADSRHPLAEQLFGPTSSWQKVPKP
jgi:hypothetical protein